MDFLFENFQKAQVAITKLKKSIENFESSELVPSGMKQWNIAGLPYEVSVDEALESLIASNYYLNFKRCNNTDLSNCIYSEHAPNSLLKVVDVRKCKKGQFRVLITMNTSIENFLNKKVKVLNTICKIYPIVFHDRCHNCHDKGHYKAQCTAPAVCPYCGGSHLSNECASDVPKCIVCVRAGYKDTSHPVYSSSCPFNN